MPETQTTSALVLREPGHHLSLETLQVAAPSPRQLLVEVIATGICHTDITMAALGSPFPAPSILGHEGSGVVRDVGSDLSGKFKVGDNVLLSFNHCGACEPCRASSPAYCQTFGVLNGPHPRADGTTGYSSIASEDAPQHVSVDTSVLAGFFGQSSFANLALVDANCAIAVPNVSKEELRTLAPLGCGVQTGAGSVINTLRVTNDKGSSFAVFGAGAVGLSAVIAAKNAGAEIIIAIDLQQSRLELAKELGATHAIDGKAPDLVAQVKAITSATSGVRYALDTTGAIPVIQNMIDCLGFLGRSVSVGLNTADATVAVPLMSMLSGGKSFGACTEGDSNPAEMIPVLISQIRSGQFPLEKLVQFYPVSDYKEAWDAMKSGTVVKPVLWWG